jgi:hypothetical protein
MDILTIGIEIPGYNESYRDFGSRTSLHDANLIIFCPNIKYDYSGGYHQGKPKFSEYDSIRIQKETDHWRNEISSALSAGQTVVCIIPTLEEFLVYTGKSELKGTGRSATTVNYVGDYNNYKSLADANLKFKSTNGTKFKCVDPTFHEFHVQFGDLLSYKAYIDSANLRPAFTTITGDKIIGGTLQVGKGYLILLPYFDFEQKEFVKKSNGNEVWNEAGIKKGKIFLDLICKIDKFNKLETDKTPQPVWLSNPKYSLKAEAKLKIAKEGIEEQIKSLTAKLVDVEHQLEEDLNLKDLLYANGKQLEYAVTKALRIMGFEAENYNDGNLELDQIIRSPEGHRLIGECEGKDNKDIDITKFRQLVDSLNEDFAKDDIQERAMGILFGNAQRLTDPEYRVLDFTLKCKNAAGREKIALIRTQDLYVVARYLIENKNEAFKKRCRASIIKQLGKIVIFPDPPIAKKAW